MLGDAGQMSLVKCLRMLQLSIAHVKMKSGSAQQQQVAGRFAYCTRMSWR